MLAISDRGAIRAAAAAATTASADGSVLSEIVTTNGNILAGFSSRGPANLLDIKPDVTAPGVNVFSSILGGKFALFSGTSMATPHVAGSAALLLQLHPDWTPAMVKSALVTSAARPAALGTSNPQNRGGGIVNLAAATTVTASLSPSVLSFRKIEPESGRSKTIDVTITNVFGTTQTYAAAAALTRTPVAPGDATAHITPSSVTLAPGQSAVFSVTVETSHASPSGQYWGDLTVTSNGGTLKAPFWFAVRTTVDAGPLQ